MWICYRTILRTRVPGTTVIIIPGTRLPGYYYILGVHCNSILMGSAGKLHASTKYEYKYQRNGYLCNH
jgi:hypothetical protein